MRTAVGAGFRECCGQFVAKPLDPYMLATGQMK